MTCIASRPAHFVNLISKAPSRGDFLLLEAAILTDLGCEAFFGAEAEAEVKREGRQGTGKTAHARQLVKGR